MQAASSSVPRIVVVGGNGYLGSAICKAAIAKGWQVDSISSSGTPSLTPAGHARRWTTDPRMRWHKASAFEPGSYAHLLGPAPLPSPTASASAVAPAAGPPTAVIHTLGILLEADYKRYVREGNVLGLARAVLGGGEDANPLATGRGGAKGKERMTYDRMNRQSAVTVLQTLRETLSSSPARESFAGFSSISARIPFIYISAEDVFPAPLVPRGYVESKRAAECEIAGLVEADAWAEERAGRELGAEGAHAEIQTTPLEPAAGRIRPVFIRPGLMYHPHIRPLSTPLAVLLDITSNIHTRMSSLFPSASSRSPLAPPTYPSGASSSPLRQPSDAPPGIRSTLATPPIHVDHVAAAVLRAVEDPHVEGVVNTRTMRAWAGWDDELDESVYAEGRREGAAA